MQKKLKQKTIIKKKTNFFLNTTGIDQGEIMPYLQACPHQIMYTLN